MSDLQALVTKKDFAISPSQGAQILALVDMLRHGELSFRGDDRGQEREALSLILDVGQEIALQVGA